MQLIPCLSRRSPKISHFLTKGNLWTQINHIINPPIENVAEVVNVFSPNSVSSKVLVKAYDDQSYGGISSSQASITNIDDELGDQKCLKFSGSVKFNKDVAKQTKAKGSFCALKVFLGDILDLRNYQGLELSVRSNMELKYTFNLGVNSLFDDDLYQLTFVVPKGSTWLTYQLPFELFQ